MSFIKKILNDESEVSRYYIVISITYSLVCFVIANDSSISELLTLLTPLIFTIYFIYIKTDNGKKNFKTVNQLMSYLFMVFAIVTGYNALKYVVEYNNLTYYTSSLIIINTIVTYILATIFYLYWIIVFFVKPERNKKLIGNLSKNNIIFLSILIGNIIVIMINYYHYLKFSFIISRLIKTLMIDGLSLILFILRLRYVYLYQNYKFKRSENNVRRNGTII